MTLSERMRPAVMTAGESARTALILNRLAARGGARALARNLRRQPRRPDWSLPYASVVEMMLLGTPNGEIRAQAIRDSIDRVSLLNVARPAPRTDIDLGDFHGEWLDTAPAGGRVLLYLHGGGYVSGSPATHRSLMVRLGHAANARVFAPAYRLAPEFPYPTAVEDAWAAYWWLLTRGVEPQQIVVAGDSAGGGLTVALMLALREANMPLPQAVSVSPPGSTWR